MTLGDGLSVALVAVSERRQTAELTAAAGVEANARLTASVAVVLLVLLALEGVTLLQLGSLLRVHVFVGMLLVPPVLLKSASTGYRFARYYTGSPAYVRKGPPHPILRLVGPLVVVLTFMVLVTGIVLLWVPSVHDRALFLHKASFVLWFGAMTVHVLGHLADTYRLAPRDLGAEAVCSRRLVASGCGRHEPHRRRRTRRARPRPGRRLVAALRLTASPTSAPSASPCLRSPSG